MRWDRRPRTYRDDVSSRTRRRSLLDHPARYVVVGFVAVISLGTVLLMLPWSTQPGQRTSLLEAAFTSTSAVCVTGLAVVDTGSHWSGFGQGVLVFLVQVGGLGFMTVSSLLVLLVSRQLGLRRRLVTNTEREALSLGDLREVLLGVGIITVSVQSVVAAVLALRFWMTHGIDAGTAAWSGVFHSVMAFNNAGFGLFPDSLVGFNSDWLVLVPIMVGIIIGGLGFPVLVDLRRVQGRWHRLTLHSKITITATIALLVLGFVLLSALEWSNPGTLGPMPLQDKALNGAFASVTPRTAGFNSIDIAAMEPQSQLATIGLMFIGAGSAGTSGGIKVATFAILALVIWSQLRGDADVTGFHRRISDSTQRRAITVALLAVALVVSAAGVLLISADTDIGPAFFEAVSAFGTVGLSTGITPTLPALDQLALMALMLVGRVGPITLGAAIVLRSHPSRYRLPEEDPLIG
jgi:potassium uptake TrkH family protein